MKNEQKVYIWLLLFLGLWVSTGVFNSPLADEISSSNQRGSVLLFPLFDIRAKTETEIRIINRRMTPVDIHLIYVCGYTREPVNPQQVDCRTGNRYISLNSYDTWVENVYDFFRPSCDEGYIIAYAVDSMGNEKGYDYLAGSYHIYKSRPMRRSAEQAIVFQSAGQVNGDGILEFNGIEYQRLPSNLSTDFQATRFSPLIASELTLLNLGIVAGGANFPTRVGVNYWNTQEQSFSLTYSFYCWSTVRLDELDVRFRENNFGSTVGFMKITPLPTYIPDDNNQVKAVVGVIKEVGGGYHTIRNLYQDVGQEGLVANFITDRL